MMRAHTRLPVNFHVTIFNGDKQVFGNAKNMSQGGIFVYAENPIQAGSLVKIRMYGNGGEKDADARVLRSYIDGSYYATAIEFVGLTPEQESDMADFVLMNELPKQPRK